MPSFASALRLAVLLALPGLGAPAHAGTEFSQCVEHLRLELPQYPKVRPETFEVHTRGAQDLRTPIGNATQTQPEFQLPIWDYLARLVDTRRIDDGRRIIDREAAVLARVAAAHRVDPATVVAIFGIESDFGRLKGRYPVVDATLGRACLGLSNRERKAHFFAALWLLQEGQVQPEEFRGSWAGAFGMTQFMPGTYLRYQTDGDGDGRIDTVHNLADALVQAREAAAASGAARVFVIGGGQLFAEALPLADTLLLTEIDADLPGDTRFPEWRTGAFAEESRDTRHSAGPPACAYAFVTYQRQR